MGRRLRGDRYAKEVRKYRPVLAEVVEDTLCGCVWICRDKTQVGSRGRLGQLPAAVMTTQAF